jgi:hypothetical protein
MMRTLFFLLVVATTLSSCGSKQSSSEFEEYFYPIDAPTKFYVYRDVANGLEEQIHRIYTLTDSYGKHLIVEIYTGDGRIIEAYNYNVDSLDLLDHMVVNAQGKKQKAEILKNTYFPSSENHQTYFASRFPGIYDSTFILREVKRKLKQGGQKKMEIMQEGNEDVLVFSDYIRQSLFNPYTHKENVVEGKALSYYAEGYGLVEWHDVKNKVHYKLEQVLDEKEGVKLLGQ